MAVPECQRPGGVHELGRARSGYKKCKHCYTSAQTITSTTRSPCKGDWRVICRGPKGTDSEVCPIGPSDPIPEVLKGYALDLYSEHQRRAVEIDGTTHDCEVIQL